MQLLYAIKGFIDSYGEVYKPLMLYMEGKVARLAASLGRRRLQVVIVGDPLIVSGHVVSLLAGWLAGQRPHKGHSNYATIPLFRLSHNG